MEDIQKIIEFGNEFCNEWRIATAEQKGVFILEFVVLFLAIWICFCFVSYFYCHCDHQYKSITELIMHCLLLAILSVYIIFSCLWSSYYSGEKCAWLPQFLFCEYVCIRLMVHMIRQGRITGEYHYTAYPIGKAVMQDKIQSNEKINDK